MNYALALLIFIFAVLSIFFLVLVGRMYNIAMHPLSPFIILPDQDLTCRPPFSNLVDVSGISGCSNTSEFLVGSKYVPSLDMVVNLVAVPFINACSSACQTGFNYTTNKCFDQQYQTAFDKCVSLTIPTGCTSLSNPVAYAGTDYYYNVHYGRGSC